MKEATICLLIRANQKDKEILLAMKKEVLVWESGMELVERLTLKKEIKA